MIPAPRIDGPVTVRLPDDGEHFRVLEVGSRIATGVFDDNTRSARVFTSFHRTSPAQCRADPTVVGK